MDRLHTLVGKSFAKVCREVPRSSQHTDDSYGSLFESVQTQIHTTKLPSQCFIAACITWCDHQWWNWRQAIGLVLGPRDMNLGWGHSRKGPHPRWEIIFVNTIGENWKLDAASTEWRKMKGSFRHKAYNLFGAKPFEERFTKKSRHGACLDERVVKK